MNKEEIIKNITHHTQNLSGREEAEEAFMLGVKATIEEYKQYSQQQTDLQRLYYWLMNDNREKAQTFFTEGELRNVAREVEFRIGKQQTVSEREEHLKDIIKGDEE